ncbi:hypothetical protein PsYK624_154360 [Phanerochaete sordida]|uniref:Uncharacterized protein n=1 Tax=Phanerochaete sordida TaxID=48140 RepID=A0A9P3GQE7_9APHY|nr:hypothetical protein PsYK624_154360 [Phanerochaete sordida]
MDVTLSIVLILLVTCSVSAHYTLTPPNAPPPAQEQAKYTEGGPAQHLQFGERGFTVVHSCAVLKWSMHLANAMAALALLFSAIAHLSPTFITIPHHFPSASLPLPSLALGTLLMALGTSLRLAATRCVRPARPQLHLRARHSRVARARDARAVRLRAAPWLHRHTCVHARASGRTSAPWRCPGRSERSGARAWCRCARCGAARRRGRVRGAHPCDARGAHAKGGRGARGAV